MAGRNETCGKASGMKAVSPGEDGGQKTDGTERKVEKETPGANVCGRASSAGGRKGRRFEQRCPVTAPPQEGLPADRRLPRQHLTTLRGLLTQPERSWTKHEDVFTTLRGQRAFKGRQVGQHYKEGFSFPAPQVQGRRLVGPPGPREQDRVLGAEGGSAPRREGHPSGLHGRMVVSQVKASMRFGPAGSPWPQGAKASDW